MYVPSYESLLRALETDKVTVEKAGKVTVPLPLFKLLLQIAIGTSDFDEDDYLANNPDVDLALRSGRIEGAYQHYLGFGYFEGRRGGVFFDDDWYLKNYTDVYRAVKASRVKSASDHYYSSSAAEGRSPNEAQEDSARQWKEALAPISGHSDSTK